MISKVKLPHKQTHTGLGEPGLAGYLDCPSPFVLDLCITNILGKTKTFHIFSNTVLPCPSQTGKRERSGGKVCNSMRWYLVQSF